MPFNRPLVKICGITNIQDGMMAINAGADMIGVVLSEISPRRGSAELVGKLKEQGATVVAVYTDIESAISESSDEDYIQLHYEHDSSHISRVKKATGKKIISVVLGKDLRNSLDQAKLRIFQGADLALIDTGISVSSIIGKDDFRIDDSRVGIAGKISPDNIREILTLRPGFIDASSMLEVYPGKKDPEKVAKLMEAFFDETGIIQRDT